jgi:hypothetical protein
MPQCSPGRPRLYITEHLLMQVRSSKSDTLTNFHMTNKHVQNIRAAIEMNICLIRALKILKLFSI